MSSASPLLFRPSPAQRAIAFLLFAGSWLVGVRGLYLVLQNLPRIYRELQAARAASEATGMLHLSLGLALLACLSAGLALAGALLGWLLVEGTHVAVDELGIAVTCGTLPGPLARRLGAGRLTWKEVTALEKGHVFFRLRGASEPSTERPGLAPPRPLRFLVVDSMDRLILLVLERSPNLRFPE